MIDLPSRLKNLVHGVVDEISAAVGSVTSSVFPLLQRNEAPFFPDYTDHGVIHIENVLSTCEHLISDEGWSVFTREDAAVLIIATLGHDLGMLINIESFKALVGGSRTTIAPLTSYDEPWEKLWLDYQLDARRFDGSTLVDITGSPEPVSIMELACDSFTDRGRNIAGEFLRRHHHRLAYEIILQGMPSETGSIDLFAGAPKYMKEVAGVVAWSHGVSIRECLTILTERERTSHREYRHIHPAFLACLVRLADYLDLDSGRAPAAILSLKSLKSPVSKREWWAHRSFVDCHSYADDPESLHVIVEPSALPDVGIFSVIEEKIDGIQREIDASWAVLGEVYGRFPPLNRLGLRIRRILSDIRLDSVTSQLPYVPHKARLESARSDLLKLLIEPLYGADPGVGIRELLQNSIDAVREMRFVEGRVTENASDIEDLIGDVVVNFEKEGEEWWVAITDRGIGMTWTSICKYYLTAGASFRQSDAWKKRFTDELGTSQVLRSGRFGIGVLAAFLVGDRVQVSTRHVEQPEDRGVEFEFGLDDTIIEMRWKKNKIGTTVKVRTTEAVIKELFRQYWGPSSWDWYCLDEPSVVRRDLHGNPLKQQFHLPAVGSQLPLYWHLVDVPGFQAVHWTYRHKEPYLVCNGILIKIGTVRVIDEFSPWEKDTRESHLVLEQPRVSVFDPDGKLPLNLSRSDLAGYYKPLHHNIAYDQCLNFIAFLLVKGPSNVLLEKGQFQHYARLSYPTSAAYSYQGAFTFNFLFSTLDGFGLTDPTILFPFIRKPILIIRGKSTDFPRLSTSLRRQLQERYECFMCDMSDGTLGGFDSWHRKAALTPTDRSECLSPFRGLKVKGMRFALPRPEHQRFQTKQIRYVVRNTRLENETAESVTLCIGDCPNAGVFSSLRDELLDNGYRFESILEYHFDPTLEKASPSFMAMAWNDVLGTQLIPFDEQERKALIKRSQTALKLHLDEWAPRGGRS